MVLGLVAVSGGGSEESPASDDSATTSAAAVTSTGAGAADASIGSGAAEPGSASSEASTRSGSTDETGASDDGEQTSGDASTGSAEPACVPPPGATTATVGRTRDCPPRRAHDALRKPDGRLELAVALARQRWLPRGRDQPRARHLLGLSPTYPTVQWVRGAIAFGEGPALFVSPTYASTSTFLNWDGAVFSRHEAARASKAMTPAAEVA